MLLATMRVLQIKDLKDLSGFFGRGYYRHAGPTDLKRCPSPCHRVNERSRGTGPRATGQERVLGP